MASIVQITFLNTEGKANIIIEKQSDLSSLQNLVTIEL